MITDEQYMQRCLALAEIGAGNTAPNPMVGAVLVHDGRIIGEGYHQQYGGPHAEVNCINSVKDEDKALIPGATMYVSLEPCAHYGKTPPCADLIIQKKIKRVVIGCRDPFTEVNGKGIEKLTAAGVEVMTGIMENECKDLNRRFFTFHTRHRPYMVLKWAQTKDGFISVQPSVVPSTEGNDVQHLPVQDASNKDDSSNDGVGEWASSPVRMGTSRLLISNEYTNRLVHKWRSGEMGILVGTNTALMDDPELTTRLWTGPSPIRLVIDMDLQLPSSLKIFNQAAPTIIFNTKIHSEESGSVFYPLSPRSDEGLGITSGKPFTTGGLMYYQVTRDVSLVHQIINALYQLKIQSVLVEGGARLLQSFIDDNMWDEARVISNEQLTLSDNRSVGKGLPAPVLSNERIVAEEKILFDRIIYYRHVE